MARGYITHIRKVLPKVNMSSNKKKGSDGRRKTIIRKNEMCISMNL